MAKFKTTKEKADEVARLLAVYKRGAEWTDDTLFAMEIDANNENNINLLYGKNKHMIPLVRAAVARERAMWELTSYEEYEDDDESYSTGSSPLSRALKEVEVKHNDSRARIRGTYRSAMTGASAEKKEEILLQYQKELKGDKARYLKEVANIRAAFKEAGELLIEQKYNASLAQLEQTLKEKKPLADASPEDRALYDSAKKMMAMAKAVKRSQVWSVPEETQKMEEILFAVDDALCHPNSIDSLERVVRLANAKDLPLNTPFSREFKVFCAVLATVTFLGVIAAAGMLAAATAGLASPLSVAMVTGAGLGLGSALTGLGFAAGAGVTSTFTGVATFFTVTLPTFMAAPLTTVGIPLELPPFASGFVSGFIASAVSVLTLLGAYKGVKAAVDYIQTPAVPLTTAFKEKAASLRKADEDDLVEQVNPTPPNPA